MIKDNFRANDHSFLDVDEDIESELSLFDPNNPDIKREYHEFFPLF